MATDEELGGAHSLAFVRQFCSGQLSDKEMRAIGLPWSKALVTYCR